MIGKRKKNMNKKRKKKVCAILSISIVIHFINFVFLDKIYIKNLLNQTQKNLGNVKF